MKIGVKQYAILFTATMGSLFAGSSVMHAILKPDLVRLCIVCTPLLYHIMHLLLVVCVIPSSTDDNQCDLLMHRRSRISPATKTMTERNGNKPTCDALGHTGAWLLRCVCDFLKVVITTVKSDV